MPRSKMNLSIALLTIVIGATLLMGCHKKNSDTSSGASNGNQSVVVLRGAAS